MDPLELGRVWSKGIEAYSSATVQITSAGLPFCGELRGTVWFFAGEHSPNSGSKMRMAATGEPCSHCFNLCLNCTFLGKTNRAFLINYYLVWGDGVMGSGVGLGA